MTFVNKHSFRTLTFSGKQRRFLGLVVSLGFLFLPVATAQAARLKPETLEAFDRYIKVTEQRFRERFDDTRPFLWSEEAAERQRRVRGGQVVVQPWSGPGEIDIPSGLIHHWVGAAFVEGVTLEEVLRLAQDYDHHKDIYQPEVMDSKLLGQNGHDFDIFLQLFKKKILTVVLKTEHRVHYVPMDEDRWHSRSYSTKIVEVKNAGTNKESELPAGKDHGFLWRLNTYWRFQETEDGVFLECEAIGLSRGVPFGFGWLVKPIIRSLPKRSMVETLENTRTTLLKRHRDELPVMDVAAGS